MKRTVSALILLVIGAFSAYSFYKGNIIAGIVGLVIFILAGLYILGSSDDEKDEEKKALTVDKEGVNSFISGEGEPDFEPAKKIREELLKKTIQDEVSIEINAAAGLMLNKDYEGSKSAYESIAIKYPQSKGKCLGQIGVAEFFLGNYEAALENYIESKNNDKDDEMTEDNIWEVCEVLYKKHGSSKAVDQYLNLYPEGRYIKKANKLVS